MIFGDKSIVGRIDDKSDIKTMPDKGVQESGCIQQFQNCMLLRDHQLIRDDFWVRDGVILNPEKLFFDEKCAADVKIDCNGALITAGFIDVQINGAFGVDFSLPHPDLEAGIQRVSKGLLAHGVTSYCPTIVTSPQEVYAQILSKYTRRNGNKDGAGILGLHLEGPFINEEKKGAHPQEYICNPKNGLPDIQAMYGDLDHVSILTLAPELPGALTTIPQLTERGITVSLGHSMANLAQGEAAVREGASFITHLFNAMLPFHHRDPHLVGLLASDKISKPIFYGVIADGIHTHPAALRIAHRTNVEGLVLVTDAVPAMGLGTGKHTIGQQKVDVTDHGAFIHGTNTLCGSVANMNECVKYFYNATECSMVEALEGSTLHPAQALGITDSKGTLDFNTDADFLLVDKSLNVLSTFIGGDLVWEAL